MSDLWSEIVYIFQRMNWLSLVDVFLVASVVFAILMLLRDTQIMVLLRGVIVISIFLVLLTTFINLPAFSWLVSTVVPALLFAIPVIFAPEIRRGLEKLGRAGSSQLLVRKSESQQQLMEKTIRAIVTAASRLSAREHGALIVLQRADNLEEYARTGVRLNADVTPELLLQIFYPNTPLHDGHRWGVCHAPFFQRYTHPLAGTSDGAAPPGSPWDFGSHRCHHRSGFRGNRIHFDCP